MTFKVEDGTGLTDSNGYVDATYFRGHHTDRGADTTGYEDARVKAAIVAATDYVDKRFGQRFRGFRQSNSQALEWPRLSAFDDDGYLLNDVPNQLKKAVAEYALLALQLGVLLPIPARPFSTVDPLTGEVTGGKSGQVVGESVRVGPIEKSVRFQDVGRQTALYRPGGAGSTMVSPFNLPEYPVADEWLRELLESSLTVDLVRA